MIHSRVAPVNPTGSVPTPGSGVIPSAPYQQTPGQVSVVTGQPGHTHYQYDMPDASRGHAQVIPMVSVAAIGRNPQDEIDVMSAFVYACLVFWFCGWIFGLVAFILAFIADQRKSSGDFEDARTMVKASKIVSIIGFSIGALALFIVIIFVMTVFL